MWYTDRGRGKKTWKEESFLPERSLNKGLYLTPVSRQVLVVLYTQLQWWHVTLELCVLTCLLTQAEIVMLEVCRDIKT